jgi:hypothetical protein
MVALSAMVEGPPEAAGVRGGCPACGLHAGQKRSEAAHYPGRGIMPTRMAACSGRPMRLRAGRCHRRARADETAPTRRNDLRDDMNTLRTSLAVAALLACGLAVAQTSGTKPATPAAPAAAKGGKGKLMTRDELRACMASNQQNEAAAAELDKKKAVVLKERDELKAAKAESDKFESDMQAQGTALKAEIESVKAFGAEIEAGASKMEKDQLKAKQEEYQARANALQPKIDAFNKARNDRVEVNKAFNTRVDAHQKIADDFNEAVEDLNDKRNEWKLKCGNRSYDEADEIAIKKEMNKK